MTGWMSRQGFIRDDGISPHTNDRTTQPLREVDGEERKRLDIFPFFAGLLNDFPTQRAVSRDGAACVRANSQRRHPAMQSTRHHDTDRRER